MKRIFKSAGVICLLLAVGLSAYNFYYDYSLSTNSNNELQELKANIEEKVTFLESNKEMDVVVQDGHSYIGFITIEPIGIELPVLYEYSYDLMSIAPTRYQGSYYDSLIICAHNTSSHFGKIGKLNVGDEIVFTDVNNNIYKYRVELIEILEKDDFEKMKNSDYDLTLFTCTLDGQKRVTVRANQ